MSRSLTWRSTSAAASVERAHQPIFTGGRDIVGDTHAMAYVGLRFLNRSERRFIYAAKTIR